MFAYGTATMSAPGAACQWGSFFGVRLIKRVVPRVAPLVRFANECVKGGGR
jgi:hypothetical protein